MALVTNTLLGVADRLVQRHLLASDSVDKLSILVVNNAAGGALVATLAWIANENVRQCLTHALVQPWRMAAWVASALVGALMGFSGALAQSQVSATSHLVITNANRVVVLVIGALTLGETLDARAVACVALSLMGNAIYAVS